MFDLVVGSFVLALTPVALGLAWQVISRISDLIECGQPVTGKQASNWKSGYTLRPDPWSRSVL
jgi:hypothetical protein